ncbi:MAG: hypothetical protein AB8H12_09460 [Lewinella sp.]
MRTLKYVVLYHLEITLISALISLLLIYPVYQAGLVILPTTFLFKLVISAGVTFLHHLRKKDASIYFMNLNFDMMKIRITFISVDIILYLLLSGFVLLLH